MPEPAASDAYTCELCGERLRKGRTDDEALAEMTARFGEVPEAERAIICDDCDKMVRAWYADREGRPDGG